MKIVLFTKRNIEKMHTLWKSFIYNPPKGYFYYNLNGRRIFKDKQKSINLTKITIKKISKKEKIFQKVFQSSLTSLNRSPLLNQINKELVCKLRSKIIDRISPDIVYCINGQFINNKIPWVVDLEHVGAFTVNFNFQGLKNNRYKRYIGNYLSSEYCKKILPYSETAKNSILKNLSCKEFIDKIEIVPNAVEFKTDVKKISHNYFNILFTGSIQNSDEFYNRGGQELLMSFLQLSEKYPKINLILRCQIPNRIKKIIQNKKNIEIYENPLTFDKFEELFLKSDLYVLPGYSGYAMSILEAMNFGLPIITTDFLENGDKVINDYNGFKIALGKNKPKFIIPYVPFHYSEKNKPIIDNNFIQNVSKTIIYVYENEIEKIRMGENSRKLLQKEFSLERKNFLLKNIYDKI